MQRQYFRAISLLFLCAFLFACGETPAESGTSAVTTDISTEATTEATPETESVETAIEAQAQRLTEQIVTFVLEEEQLGNAYVAEDKDIYQFLVTLIWYADDPTHPYGDMVKRSDDGMTWSLSLADAQRAAAELFGRTDWTQDSFSNESFDDAAQCYRFNIGVGHWTSAFDYKDMRAEVTDDAVRVTCRLVNSTRYEYSACDYGDYTFVFRRESADGREFLRFVGTEAAATAPSENTAYVVKIREVIPVLEWQHTLPVAESDDPLRIVMTLPDEPASGLGVEVMGSATLNEVDSSEKMRKELVLSLAYMWGVNTKSYADGVTASGMPYVSSLSAIGQWTDRGIENQLSVYVRVADNYIWRCDFLFLQDTIPTQIYEALDSICLLGTLPQPYAVYDCSVSAERQTVTLTELPFRSYDDWGTQGKSEVTIQLRLPQDWTNQSVSYVHDSYAYTPFAAPTHAGAANRAEVCPFPAFSYEETLLLTASDVVFDADFVGEESKYMSGYYSYKLLAKETEQGVTASGMPYVLFRCEIGDYRTTRYHAAVRLTDTYVFSFDLYTAPDDTALIDEILDSIRCVEKSGGA